MARRTRLLWLGKCNIKFACSKTRCRGHQHEEEKFSEVRDKILETRSKAKVMKCRLSGPGNRRES